MSGDAQGPSHRVVAGPGRLDPCRPAPGRRIALGSGRGGRAPGQLRGAAAPGRPPCSSTAGVSGPTPTGHPSGHGRAGCRVYAPALPGFGGTRELPADQRTFAGYAAWVGRFLDAVGAARGGAGRRALLRGRGGHRLRLRPALAGVGPVAGQRHRQPDLGALPQRGPDHGAAAGLGLGPPLLHRPAPLAPAAPPAARRSSRTSSPTWCSNPLGMFRTGEFIRRADLVREVRAIAQLGHPGHGGLVRPGPPGAPLGLRRSPPRRRRGRGGGRGAHAWLIADPDRLRRAGHQRAGRLRGAHPRSAVDATGAEPSADRRRLDVGPPVGAGRR